MHVPSPFIHDGTEILVDEPEAIIVCIQIHNIYVGQVKNLVVVISS